MVSQSKVKIISNINKALEYAELALMELNKEGLQEKKATQNITDIKNKLNNELDSLFSDPIITQ